VVADDAQATLAALLATGAPIGEAFGMAALACGRDAIRPLLVQAIMPKGATTTAATLRDVAKADPVLAQEGLTAWGRNREVEGTLHLNNCPWVTSIPKGLMILNQCDLDLDGTSITSLPAGLQVGGTLNLSRTPLRTLPAGLDVGHCLWLQHCPKWDGQIPADTKVNRYVITPRHPFMMHQTPQGLGLDAWRAQHPLGERKRGGHVPA
jgi:hypothetical protein